MNLGDVRTEFVKLSGREDLINSDDSDNGADFFINSGQKFLDRRIDFRKSTGRIFKPLSINGWYVSFERCRSIDKVWANDSEERWEIKRKDLYWLHNQFPEIVSSTDSGNAKYWAPANLRGVDITNVNGIGTLFNYVMPEGNQEDLDGIVILPPTDTALTIEVWGKFYSPKLRNDNDVSYWSTRAEDTLILAALYRLEIFYRNTEGAKDWLAAIDLDLMDIDKDTVHEDNVNVDALEG